MPKYTITRTVDITLEVEADTLVQALQKYYLNEHEGEYDEVNIEVWDDDARKRIGDEEIWKAQEEI